MPLRSREITRCITKTAKLGEKPEVTIVFTLTRNLYKNTLVGEGVLEEPNNFEFFPIIYMSSQPIQKWWAEADVAPGLRSVDPAIT